MLALGVEQSTRITRSHEPYIPLSLYKGDMGLAVLAAELQYPEAAAMPLFEDERWPRGSEVQRARAIAHVEKYDEPFRY